jgi:hypothetical protein
MKRTRTSLPAIPAPRPTPWAAGLLAFGLSLLYLLALLAWSLIGALLALP